MDISVLVLEDSDSSWEEVEGKLNFAFGEILGNAKLTRVSSPEQVRKAVKASNLYFLDVCMKPGDETNRDGLKAIDYIRKQFPRAYIIAMSSLEENRVFAQKDNVPFWLKGDPVSLFKLLSEYKAAVALL